MKRTWIAFLGLIGLAPQTLFADADQPFVGEVIYVGFNFCPKGWARADRQLLPISQNTALFALLGTYYGGDGKSNFALPNLQGRFDVGVGQGAGLSQVDIGQEDGSSTVTLIGSEIPAHIHELTADTSKMGAFEKINISQKATLQVVTASSAEERLPRNNRIATAATAIYSTKDTVYKDSLSAVSLLSKSKLPYVSASGGSMPMNIMPPYRTLNACIALQGVFPPRN